MVCFPSIQPFTKYKARKTTVDLAQKFQTIHRKCYTMFFTQMTLSSWCSCASIGHFYLEKIPWVNL